jgi:hypothetical protein
MYIYTKPRFVVVTCSGIEMLVKQKKKSLPRARLTLAPKIMRALIQFKSYLQDVLLKRLLTLSTLIQAAKRDGSLRDKNLKQKDPPNC